MASFVDPGRPSAKNLDLSYAGKGNVFHPYRSKKLFFAVHDRSPARYKRAWSGMFNDVGGWDRAEINIDSDDRASWIENGSPCPESPGQMARTRVVGLARDLQHTQCTSASARWSLLFSWSPVIKCQPDSRERAEEVPSLPVTRGCGEALQECYQATDWL